MLNKDKKATEIQYLMMDYDLTVKQAAAFVTGAKGPLLKQALVKMGMA